MDQLPFDILQEITKNLCVLSVYRDKYELAKDAVSFYCASKSCTSTRFISKEILTSILKGKTPGGFERDEVYNNLSDASNVRQLKSVCRELNLPSSGTKKHMLDRIADRKKQRWCLIIDEGLRNELFQLRYKVVSPYTAKNSFGLDNQHLSTLDCIGNGYKLREVKALSLSLYESEDGLRLALKKKQENKRLKAEARADRISKRRIELHEELTRLNCVNEGEHIKACELYIKNDIGTARDIARAVQELKFLKQYTIFDEIIEEYGNVEDSHNVWDVASLPHELYVYARRLAMKEWLRQFSHKQAAFESPELPENLKKYVLNAPRYVFQIT